VRWLSSRSVPPLTSGVSRITSCYSTVPRLFSLSHGSIKSFPISTAGTHPTICHCLVRSTPTCGHHPEGQRSLFVSPKQTPTEAPFTRRSKPIFASFYCVQPHSSEWAQTHNDVPVRDVRSAFRPTVCITPSFAAFTSRLLTVLWVLSSQSNQPLPTFRR
jgi:hypothetical protein